MRDLLSILALTSLSLMSSEGIAFASGSIGPAIVAVYIAYAACAAALLGYSLSLGVAKPLGFLGAVFLDGCLPTLVVLLLLRSLLSSLGS
jgi:hypothetical protein